MEKSLRKLTQQFIEKKNWGENSEIQENVKVRCRSIKDWNLDFLIHTCQKGRWGVLIYDYNRSLSVNHIRKSIDILTSAKCDVGIIISNSFTISSTRMCKKYHLHYLTRYTIQSYNGRPTQVGLNF